MYWSVFLQTDKTHHLLLLIQWSLASLSDFSGQEKNLWTEFKLENAVEKKNKFFNPTIFIDFLTPSTKMSHLQLKCRSLPGYFHTTPCCPWINLCSALKLILSQFWVRVQIKELTHSHTFPFHVVGPHMFFIVFLMIFTILKFLGHRDDRMTWYFQRNACTVWNDGIEPCCGLQGSHGHVEQAPKLKRIQINGVNRSRWLNPCHRMFPMSHPILRWRMQNLQHQSRCRRWQDNQMLQAIYVVFCGFDDVSGNWLVSWCFFDCMSSVSWTCVMSRCQVCDPKRVRELQEQMKDTARDSIICTICRICRTSCMQKFMEIQFSCWCPGLGFVAMLKHVDYVDYVFDFLMFLPHFHLLHSGPVEISGGWTSSPKDSSRIWLVRIRS